MNDVNTDQVVEQPLKLVPGDVGTAEVPSQDAPASAPAVAGEEASEATN